MIIVDVGYTGSGKGFRSIQFSKNKKYEKPNKYVIDPECEYVLEKHLKQINPNTSIVSVLNWIKNSFTIIDCAHYYFPMHPSESELKIILKALGGARHAANKNIIYLTFHSLGDVPVYVRRQMNQLILGHTYDAKDVINRYGYKDNLIKKYFEELRTKHSKNPHACFTI